MFSTNSKVDKLWLEVFWDPETLQKSTIESSVNKIYVMAKLITI